VVETNMTSISVTDLRSPLFTVEQVAVATGKSVNQIRHLHRTGRLEEAKTLAGESFRPTGAILITAREVLRLLDGVPRKRFLAWQCGEIEDLAEVSR
jgi:hypothetical protein